MNSPINKQSRIFLVHFHKRNKLFKNGRLRRDFKPKNEKDLKRKKLSKNQGDVLKKKKKNFLIF